jgi:serine/threonine protein kinase
MPGMSLRPGELFAGYTIERELGSGGMGAVYLARHPRLPRSDALKLLRTELCDDPNFVGRFEREADTVAQLDHPNIVAVYDRGSADGQLWISMRFIDGTTADRALAGYDGGMPPERAVRIVARVASALDYAHRKQLLHRDVKPANILLAAGSDDDDESEQVFLSDFGVAKAMGAAADRIASLTTTGSVVATLDYASPEQIKGQPLDHRTDIYALGCVLYKLLTGRVPFPGDSIAARVYGHINSPARPPSTLVEGLPVGFDDVVATAMAKDPDDRYPSCRALAQAAAVALTSATVRDEPPDARPDDDRTTTVTGHRAVGPGVDSPSEPPPPRLSRSTITGPAGTMPPNRPTAPPPESLGTAMRPPSTRPPGTRPPGTWPDSQDRPEPSGREHHGAAGPPPGRIPVGSASTSPQTRTPGVTKAGAADRSSRRWVWVSVAVAAVVLVGAAVVALVLRGPVGGTAAPPNGTATSTPNGSTGLTYGPSPTPVTVTSSGPVAGLPHATPLGDQAVVVPQVVDGAPDLYAVDTGTLESVARLTTGASGTQAPVLSPDRGSVIYVQSSAISGTIRTVAVDGTNDHVLWDNRPADCQTYFRPAWNPIDQTRLAVVCVTTQGIYALSEIGIDSTVHATVDTGLAVINDVSYAPDATMLTFWGTDAVGATTSAIYTQPADGSSPPTAITDGTAADTGPMFSPDGSRIVFSRSVAGGQGSTIMVVGTGGGDPQPLTDGAAHDRDPAWSPDGTRIVFRSDRSTGDENSSQFWVMQANGADPSPLMSSVANGPPAWSRR